MRLVLIQSLVPLVSLDMNLKIANALLVLLVLIWFQEFVMVILFLKETFGHLSSLPCEM